MSKATSIRNAWRLGGMLLGAAVLAGCATVAPQTTEEQVMARAQARWDALVAKDAKKAYELMVPSYRALVSYQDFLKQMPTQGRWNEAAIHSAKCEAERCQVKVRISASVIAPLPGLRPGQAMDYSTYFDEPWVREDGQWWFYQAP